MIKVHCVHMWECYNETPYYVHSVYTYKKKKKRKKLNTQNLRVTLSFPFYVWDYWGLEDEFTIL
jgi:hypothetical protein